MSAPQAMHSSCSGSSAASSRQQLPQSQVTSKNRAVRAQHRFLGDLCFWRCDAADDGTTFETIPPDVTVSVFVVRYAPGVDRRAAFERLQHDFGSVVLQHIAARDVENLVHVAAFPASLAWLLVSLAVATLLHALLAVARRRPYWLGILKAIGFVRGQLATPDDNTRQRVRVVRRVARRRVARRRPINRVPQVSNPQGRRRAGVCTPESP